MRFKKSLKLFLVVLLISLPFIALTQRTALYDWTRLRNYQAPAEIIKLATDTSMQNSSRRLFYVYHPSIESKAVFNDSCRDGEQTIVLGCYVSGSGIHILNVEDTRLNGIKQVTAAHEMLHAAYERLSINERKKVDTMTSSAFALVTDERVKQTVDLYRKSDAKVVPNELHSILATEVRNLPADLEAYYSRYFTDRSKVVGYSEQYEQAFTERKNQLDAYDAQLTSLKSQIDTLQAKLLQEKANLDIERDQLDAKRSTNVSAYNAGVAPFNAHVASYNKKVDALTSLIDEYNGIIPKRNALADEEKDLVQAIDSRTSVPSRQ